MLPFFVAYLSTGSMLTILAEVQATLKSWSGGGDDEKWEDGECSVPIMLLSCYIMLTFVSGIQEHGVGTND